MNNANYIRYAESARVNWIMHFSAIDPAHRGEWRELMKPKATGLILKSITAEYKFVGPLLPIYIAIRIPLSPPSYLSLPNTRIAL